MNKPELTPEQLLIITARLKGYLEHFNITDLYGNDKNVMTVVEPKKFVDKDAVYEAITKKVEVLDFVTVKKPTTFVDENGFEDSINETFVFQSNSDAADQLTNIDKRLQSFGYPILTNLKFIKHTLDPKFDPQEGRIGYNTFTIVRLPELSYEVAIMNALRELEKTGSIDWGTFDKGIRPDI